jgi:hypothetical protein
MAGYYYLMPMASALRNLNYLWINYANYARSASPLATIGTQEFVSEKGACANTP